MCWYVLVCSVPLLGFESNDNNFALWKWLMSCITHLWIHVYPFLSFRSTRSVGPIPKTLGHAPGMEQQWNCGYGACSWRCFTGNHHLPAISMGIQKCLPWSLAFWQSGEMPKNANLASLGGFMQRRVQVRVLWRCNRGSAAKKRNLQLLEGIMIPVALDVCFIYMHEPSPIFSRMNAQNKEHKGRERSLSIQHITPQDTSTTSSNGKGRPEHIVWHTNYSLPCYVLQLYITK